MKRAVIAALTALGALAAYLLLWPTGVEPVAWNPPPPPSTRDGVYAYNEKLKGIQRLAEGLGVGPEGIDVDAAGQVYAGYADGRIVRLSPDGGSHTELVDTGGRPLGLALAADGGVVIADARKGLLHFGRELAVLATAADGVPLGFTDDVDSALDGQAYFSDASHKFGIDRYRLDFLEHGPNGRLLAHDPGTGQTRLLLSGLHFANGVALGPDDAYVLVNETARYRILRYWLKGEKAGSHEVFIDNLPGFPDNLSFNGRDRFWVALASPRDPVIEQLLPGSFLLRKVIARLPTFLQPGPKRHSFVLGLDLDGKVVANLQYAGADAYAPITSVREHGSWLYFGSLTYPAVGRLPLNQGGAGAQPAAVAAEFPGPARPLVISAPSLDAPAARG